MKIKGLNFFLLQMKEQITIAIDHKLELLCDLICTDYHLTFVFAWQNTIQSPMEIVESGDLIAGGVNFKRHARGSQREFPGKGLHHDDSNSVRRDYNPRIGRRRRTCN